MQIKPLGERVLVKPTKQEAETKSGILLATDDKAEKADGTIIAISDGANLNDLQMDIKVGDTVIFGKYAGDDYEHDGEKLKFLNVGDLLGIILDAKKE